MRITFSTELRLVQMRVQSTLCQQFAVRAALDNPPAIEVEALSIPLALTKSLASTSSGRTERVVER